MEYGHRRKHLSTIYISNGGVVVFAEKAVAQYKYMDGT